jgi:hypothetical protein
VTIWGNISTSFALILEAPIAYKTLQFANSDRFALDTQDARALALILLRTYSTTDARQRTILGDDGRSGSIIALGNLADEGGDINIYGTRRNASRIFTIQAT